VANIAPFNLHGSPECDDKVTICLMEAPEIHAHTFIWMAPTRTTNRQRLRGRQRSTGSAQPNNTDTHTCRRILFLQLTSIMSTETVSRECGPFVKLGSEEGGCVVKARCKTVAEGTRDAKVSMTKVSMTTTESKQRDATGGRALAGISLAAAHTQECMFGQEVERVWQHQRRGRAGRAPKGESIVARVRFGERGVTQGYEHIAWRATECLANRA
jgi:hypothetical protein